MYILCCLHVLYTLYYVYTVYDVTERLFSYQLHACLVIHVHVHFVFSCTCIYVHVHDNTKFPSWDLNARYSICVVCMYVWYIFPLEKNFSYKLFNLKCVPSMWIILKFEYQIHTCTFSLHTQSISNQHSIVYCGILSQCKLFKL